MSKEKGGSRNSAITSELRKLADWIEKEGVVITSNNIKISAGHGEGVDPENMMLSQYRSDGTYQVNIDLKFYDAEKDKTDELYYPMDAIRKEVGY